MFEHLKKEDARYILTEKTPDYKSHTMQLNALQVKNKCEESGEELWKDYLALTKKYIGLLENYEFGYLLIQFSVKMLMDIAPKHRVALETIKIATEEGIKWHVEERAQQNKGGNHE